MNANFEITDYRVTDDPFEMNPNCRSIESYHVDARAKVTHGGETRTFTLVLQNEVRCDIISGHIRVWGGRHKCGIDETQELRDWLEGKNNALLEAIECEFTERAENKCKRMMEEEIIDTRKEFTKDINAERDYFLNTINKKVKKACQDAHNPATWDKLGSKKEQLQALVEYLKKKWRSADEYFEDAQIRSFPIVCIGSPEEHWFYDESAGITGTIVEQVETSIALIGERVEADIQNMQDTKEPENIN